MSATRIDFYQLSRDPVERVATTLARKVMGVGARLLIVHDDGEMRATISRELWRAGDEEFLANGEAGQAGAERQPILLSAEIDTANEASMVILADGKWRNDAINFDRAMLLFGVSDTEAARALWRELDGEAEVTREIHKQDENGRWHAGG
jgi:DNA polymerase-3 subunit chi